MATKTFKIGLSNTDKQNMAQDVYERLLALTFPEYDTETSYDVGDFVVYNDQLYKCIGATSGAWDNTKWQLATLNDLLTDIEDAVQYVNDKANVDGNYPTMTVGVADQLSPYDDESGDDQSEPFSFQATGTGNGTQPDFATGIIALMKEKQGNTVVVNQRVSKDIISTQTINGVTITNNNDGTFTLNETATDDIALYLTSALEGLGHKWLVGYFNLQNDISGLIMRDQYSFGSVSTMGILTLSGTFAMALVIANGTVLDNVKVEPKVIDLTQWFNGDIPQDLLDHPENFFRYYQGSLAYNAGELVNANGRYVKCIGRQQWDEEWELSGSDVITKNIIKVIPNAQYYIHTPYSLGNYGCTVYEYDKDGSLINTKVQWSSVYTASPNANGIKIEFYSGYGTTYNHDITISLYYEGESGYNQYYPYEELTNNDTGTETLRSAGSVHDVKLPSGTIKRNVLEYTFDNSWETWTANGNSYQALNTSTKLGASIKGVWNVVCINSDKLNPTTQENLYSNGNTLTKSIAVGDNGNIHISQDLYANLSQLVGVKIYVQLATPTTEQGTPYSENLVIDDFGSMDFQGANGVPQGNLIFYPVDYKAFIDTLYDYTEGTPSNIALNSELNAKFETYLKSLSGYDATATQVLKNVEGTLTWVTEE